MSHTQPSVFITGVSSGIGHALAKAYLDKGASVYGISRSIPYDLIEDPAFHFIHIDLSDLKTISTGLTKLLGNVSHLDNVVLNAGLLGTVKDIRDTELDELELLMNVNVWANKRILDWLSEQSFKVEQVIAISSGASVKGQQGWGGYCISKSSLNMLIELYAAEMPDTHFTSLSPGLVDTPMQDYLCDEAHDPKYTSLGRLKEARHTNAMPTPEVLAPRLLSAFDKCRTFPSGEYHDIRKMKKKGQKASINFIRSMMINSGGRHSVSPK